MTKEELKLKLDAAQEKVDKRINIITKACKKLDLNVEELLTKFRQIDSSHYVSRDKLKEIFGITMENENDYRDSEGRWTDKCEEVSERNHKVYDLLDSFYKLRELEQVRDNWKVKYDIQVNKENAPKIQVLVDFLNEWKELAFGWYVENCNYAVKMMNKFHNVAHKYLEDTYDWSNLDYSQRREVYKDARVKFNQHMYDTFYVQPAYRNSYVNEQDMLRAKNISAFTQEIMRTRFESEDRDSYGQQFGHQEYKGQFVLQSIDETLLKKTLEKEAQAKYEDLCNRISAVVGEIEDVSNLHIARNGQLNGTVVGSRGSAKVETIGAGGYNIQCFHYRTLVHSI